MRREALFASLMTLQLATAACEGASPTGPSAFDFGGLVDGLRRAGATVVPGGEISQPFFSVKGRVIGVNSEDVQVFEYPNVSAAEADAARISPDGSTIGTTKIAWLGPPHFYRKDRIIALYVGDVAPVKTLLETVLGPQFAGR